MRKLVVLKLDGNLNTGVRVTLEIGAENQRPFAETSGKLPPNKTMIAAIEEWNSNYRSLWKFARIKAKKISYDGSICKRRRDCYQSIYELKEQLNCWLLSESFRPIRDKWLKYLTPSDEIRVLIRTTQMELKKLPWHLWDLVEKDYPKAEITLSVAELEHTEVINTSSHRNKLKILAILGDSDGIDVEKDRQLLKDLPGAATTFLVEPQRQDINNHLWNQPWSILFFAGHSKTEDDKGRIYINDSDSLTITELRYALRNAVKNGLQLAIFNSCDGLGLARELQDLQIPQVIVMREPVPDLIAQEFLKYFLLAFSHGNSIYTAVRAAREKLQGLEGEYPGASCLPIICEHPAKITPMTWNSSQLSDNNPLKVFFLASVLITASVLGIRHKGILQESELQAFDTIMRQYPSESKDSRLLIVEITENDLKLPEQEQRKGSLSDTALAQVLDQLVKFQARTIGLDIYRDFPAKFNPELVNKLQTSDNFFAICKVRNETSKDPGIAPPPEIPLKRQGFSDVVLDTDNVLRRHLLAINPASPISPCVAHSALSTQLALHYLKEEGINASYDSDKNLKVGKIVFKQLQSRMGPYQKIDAQGNQILLNYRNNKGSIFEIAPRITLTDVLNGKLKPEAVKNKIVIIGTTAQSYKDYISTPYSKQSEFHQQIPGVIIQAQMVSQIVSAVKDNRPLLSVLPIWGEILWIWSWGLVGGVISWRFRKGIYLVLASFGAISILYFASYFLFFSQGVLIPLIPSALVLIFTGSIIVIYFNSPEQGNYLDKIRVLIK
ncbi:CHASE2 domain-containing protein [Calothrix rhizosoleniae]|uniref:CHASE2 domain-containing protein n=1 Tax=Calothrix rhizosoleniae TaxID=888997 RepID=UPI000B4A49B9|nr:CHASE2 domain-containing protein [Calothrix rhizosoleniae]